MNQLHECIKLMYRLFRVNIQLICGAWRVFSLTKPIVSIFGSARMQQDDRYAKMAHRLSQMLVEDDISVLTGGGPGIMQAASCGAIESQEKDRGRTMGIGVKDLKEEENPCVEEYFELDYFFARKWLLTRYSTSFIIFPGGFGTVDELSEVLTLMQTNRMPRVPIVMIGKEYWKPFIEWVTDEALQHGLISQKDLDLFFITDDIDEAFCVVTQTCSIYDKKKHPKEN
jgi:uncharacterized protein (TIGR00730 family)